MDLDTVADELYGLTPAEFTAARDSRVADARRARDRELAVAVKALKRPSVGAWLANLLVRRGPDEVDRLLSLAADLREARTGWRATSCGHCPSSATGWWRPWCRRPAAWERRRARR